MLRIRDDSFQWIVVAVSTYTTNTLVRLGWIRFALFSAVQATCGNRVAVRFFGLTAWTKLHDEMKVYLGYFKFIPVLALVAARAIVHGLQPFDQPQTPGFSLTASCAIFVLILTEILEDVTVSVSPLGCFIFCSYKAQEDINKKQEYIYERAAFRVYLAHSFF